MLTAKNKEDKLRRLAARLGYRLEKSRTRNPNRPEFGGYMVVDIQTNGVVHGFGEAFQYTAVFGMVEREGSVRAAPVADIKKPLAGFLPILANTLPRTNQEQSVAFLSVGSNRRSQAVPCQPPALRA
jgi:L-alanine-DL-glutamate epimerase-like enolase superfamily enzyme